MRDTEPFSTSRVQVKVLTLPGVARGAHHLALVTRGQVCAIWRQHRRIRCRHVNALLFLAHGVQRHRVIFQLVDGEAREHSVVGISSQSSLIPIGTGFVLVKQRVTWQAVKYPVRKVNAVVLASEASSGPVAQPTTQVPPTVEFVRSGASSFSFWARMLAEQASRSS